MEEKAGGMVDGSGVRVHKAANHYLETHHFKKKGIKPSTRRLYFFCLSLTWKGRKM